MAAQSTSNILMIEPTYFEYNVDAATDNVYMKETSTGTNDVRKQVGQSAI